MRKQFYLFVSLVSILFMASCSKENLQSVATTRDSAMPFTAISSEWTTDKNFAWTDGTSNSDPSRQTSWDVSELTQEMIENRGVLVFAKSNIDGSIQSMPAAFYDASANTGFDEYHYDRTPGSISIVHFKSVDGVYEMPTDANEISFRYILVTEAMPPSSGRTPADNAKNLSISDLHALPYDKVVEVLGISK